MVSTIKKEDGKTWRATNTLRPNSLIRNATSLLAFLRRGIS
jgi:hypothetical protein